MGEAVPSDDARLKAYREERSELLAELEKLEGGSSRYELPNAAGYLVDSTDERIANLRHQIAHLDQLISAGH